MVSSCVLSWRPQPTRSFHDGIRRQQPSIIELSIRTSLSHTLQKSSVFALLVLVQKVRLDLSERNERLPYCPPVQTDLESGNKKLVLGTLWSLFRKLRLESIQEEGKSSEDGLLLWIRKMTDGYDGVNVTNFKVNRQLVVGLSFCIACVDYVSRNLSMTDWRSLPSSMPSTRSFWTTTAWTSPIRKEIFAMRSPRLKEKWVFPAFLTLKTCLRDRRMNGENLFTLSRRGSVTVLCRSVILYCSLFFHAFTAAEKNMAENSRKQEMADKMTELEMQLQAASDEKEQVHPFFQQSTACLARW